MPTELVKNAEILLNRIEANGFELDRRICVLRASGDPVEIPIDLETIVGITRGFLAATPLTDDQITDRVNDVGANRTTDERLITVAAHLQTQLDVNREQSRTIAKLVDLVDRLTTVEISGITDDEHIQLGRQSGFNQAEHWPPPESPPTGHEDESAGGGGEAGH